MPNDRHILNSSHWGIGVVHTDGQRILDVTGHSSDPNPSPLNTDMAEGLNSHADILCPAIRESWLPGEKGERGRDPFVEVSWEIALSHVTSELGRVRKDYGNRHIFEGSYGWSSAGRFHYAQSRPKRFLNTIGGFVRSKGNYSCNAALVAMPHIFGGRPTIS